LASAVFTNEGDPLTWRQAEADVAHRPAVAARILKADVFKDEALAYRLRHFESLRWRGDRRLHLEEVEEVFQVERLLRDLASANQQRVYPVGAARKRAGQKGQRADADRPTHGAYQDNRIRAIIAGGADNRQPG